MTVILVPNEASGHSNQEKMPFNEYFYTQHVAQDLFHGVACSTQYLSLVELVLLVVPLALCRL